MEDYNDIDTKALAYAQRREGRCLGKVSPNTYLWLCKKGHQWEAPYKNMKQNYKWCNICPNIPEEHASIYLRIYYIKNFHPESLNSWRDYI